MRYLLSQDPSQSFLKYLQYSVGWSLQACLKYLQVFSYFQEQVSIDHVINRYHIVVIHPLSSKQVLLLLLKLQLSSHYHHSSQMAVHLLQHLLVVCIETPFHSYYIYISIFQLSQIRF